MCDLVSDGGSGESDGGSWINLGQVDAFRLQGSGLVGRPGQVLYWLSAQNNLYAACK